MGFIEESELDTEDSSGFISELELDPISSSETEAEIPTTTGSIAGDAYDAVGGFGRKGLEGILTTALTPADWLASGVNYGLDSLGVGGGDELLGASSPTGLISKMFDIAYGDTGEKSTAGRIASKAGDFTGDTLGFATGAGALKQLPAIAGSSMVTRGLGKLGGFLGAAPTKQAAVAALGGTAGGVVKEAGGTEGQQLTAELATMLAPDLTKTAYNLAKIPARKYIYQPAQDAASEIWNSIMNATGDTRPLLESTGEASAQVGRENLLGEMIKGLRTTKGQDVGAAKAGLRSVSDELADDAARLSDLKYEAKYPTRTTNLDEVHAEMNRLSAKLKSAPDYVEVTDPINVMDEVFAGTNREVNPAQIAASTIDDVAPLTKEKYGDTISMMNRGKVFEEVGAKTAVEKLAKAKGVFSKLATNLQKVFKTGRDVSEDAYIEAASKVGARLKNAQTAAGFKELAGESKEIMGLGRSALLQETFKGTPTSWTQRINDNRGAFVTLFGEKELAGLDAVARKSKDLVGGLMVSQYLRFAGNKLLLAGVVGGAAVPGVSTATGMIAGGALSKLAKTVAEKPQVIQNLLSKAWQNPEFAKVLSQRATPENLKAATEYLESAGRAAIMGLSASGGDENMEKAEAPIVSDMPITAERSAPVGDVDLTPKELPAVEKELVDAVISIESSGNPRAVSEGVEAKGLMQIMDGTGKQLFKDYKHTLPEDASPEKYDPFNAKQNKALGTAYLGELLDKFGDPALALTAYHSGPGTVAALLKHSKGSTLEDILNYSFTDRKGKHVKLGPKGREYAASVIKRLERNRNKQVRA